jgi:hypothetical protein
MMIVSVVVYLLLEAKSDVNDIHGDESNIDADSDNETRTTNASIKTETKPTIGQGSSGLLLLAAAAEQKRKDEEGKFNLILFFNIHLIN